MNLRRLIVTASAVAIGSMWAQPMCVFSAAATPKVGLTPANVQDELEVMTRGPVHEAFAQPVVFDPKTEMAVPEAPPEAIEESPPDQRPAGENVVWISGYWSWDDDRGRFIWVSGIWRVVPAGLEWVPGYWTQTREGSQWVSGFWRRAEEEEVTYLPEPPESVEAGPVGEPPSADHIWAPGTWVWHETRYAWRPGYWVHAYPGWIWTPAHYVRSPYGYVFVDGFWDYSVRRRGVLFAPVYFRSDFYAAPGYSYSPAVVIDSDILTDHFFARPCYHHYYFGDYYAPSYLSVGIYPWFSFHLSHYGYDPIFAYYRWHYRRTDRHWDERLHDA